MAIGDVFDADCTDLYYVDTGMYGVPEYGSVYIVDAERPALVDTGLGTNRQRVLDALDAVGLAPADVAVIALTHVHLDHAGGAGFLVEDCPDADVYVHDVGAPHVVDPARLWEGTKRAVGDAVTYYTEPEPVPESRITTVEDGATVGLGDHELAVHDAPGHAPHQVVYHDAAIDAVFTGDAAGIYTPSADVMHPTSPPPNFDPEECLDDVGMLRDLDPDYVCHGHFGANAADDLLDRFADTIESWVDAVAEKRVELDDDDAVVDYFVERADDARECWGEEKAAQEVELNVRGVLVALDRQVD